MSHKYRVSKLNKATLSIVSLLILSACNDDSSSKSSYEATITYTSITSLTLKRIAILA